MKILLAEDDPVTRESLGELLTAEGYEVHAAADGLKAAEIWEKLAPDLILLDIMMPGASGYEVCRRIRGRDRRVPILFLSAKSEEIDVVLGLELGADDFIRKPFGKHELLARIRATLRRKHPGHGEAESFDIGPWKIFPNRLEAIRGEGLSVDLTGREVKILRLLNLRRGEVVTRDQLLNECWGLEYFPESRTLDQHILNLRKKLEDDPAAPRWIATVRGVGYRHPL